MERRRERWVRARARKGKREKERMRWMYEWMNRTKIAMVTVHITVALIEPFVVVFEWLRLWACSTQARYTAHAHTQPIHHHHASVQCFGNCFCCCCCLFAFCFAFKGREIESAHNRPDVNTQTICIINLGHLLLGNFIMWMCVSERAYFLCILAAHTKKKKTNDGTSSCTHTRIRHIFFFIHLFFCSQRWCWLPQCMSHIEKAILTVNNRRQWQFRKYPPAHTELSDNDTNTRIPMPRVSTLCARECKLFPLPKVKKQKRENENSVCASIEFMLCSNCHFQCFLPYRSYRTSERI